MLTLTNKSARIVVFNVGGGQTLFVNPLATLTVEDPAHLEAVASALEGPYKALVDAGDIIPGGVSAADAAPSPVTVNAAPTPASTPPTAAPFPAPSADPVSTSTTTKRK